MTIYKTLKTKILLGIKTNSQLLKKFTQLKSLTTKNKNSNIMKFLVIIVTRAT